MRTSLRRTSIERRIGSSTCWIPSWCEASKRRWATESRPDHRRVRTPSRPIFPTTREASPMPDWQWAYDGWILVVTALVAVICAIPGSFLLVRRQAMLGDAVAHAVLPGIAIGFLVSGTRSGSWMLVGAVVAGLTTAGLTQLLRSIGGVDRGSALGVVFSTLFALGLVLIVQAADSVDLDPACVLYGQIELVPLDVLEIFGMDVPRAIPWMLLVLVATGLAMGFLWKEFLITSFDSPMAESQGIPTRTMHQLLMILVASGCVVAFESVGSILVLALLIGPPATARLLTGSLFRLVLLAAVIGVFISISGHLLAILVPIWMWEGESSLSTAGVTAVLSMFIFCGLILLKGVAGRVFWRRMRSRSAVQSEFDGDSPRHTT
ncbi:MAG: iron ABC transporter [Phycisphaerae bacterium]|nr:iron ABC transporter [Phycisphaerae bacterium]